MKKLNVKRTSDSAQLPTYGTAGAACFDLYADDTVSIWPGKAATIKTSVAFEIPDGHVMLVYSRSGHGFKSGVRLANCTGVIDSDYRNEVMVRIKNDGSEVFVVTIGDRIAQAMITPVEKYEFIEVDTLSDTARGLGGLGSTGR